MAKAETLCLLQPEHTRVTQPLLELPALSMANNWPNTLWSPNFHPFSTVHPLCCPSVQTIYNTAYLGNKCCKGFVWCAEPADLLTTPRLGSKQSPLFEIRVTVWENPWRYEFYFIFLPVQQICDAGPVFPDRHPFLNCLRKHFHACCYTVVSSTAVLHC